MTITEKLAKIARDNPDAEPRLLARRVIARLSQPEIIQLIADEIRRLQRQSVRAVEHDALDALFARGGSDVRVVTVARGDPFRALFGWKLAVGHGGPKIKVEDMTLEQWIARRAMLIAMRDGTDKAIEICDAAIATLTSAGAPTLGHLRVAA